MPAWRRASYSLSVWLLPQKRSAIHVTSCACIRELSSGCGTLLFLNHLSRRVLELLATYLIEMASPAKRCCRGKVGRYMEGTPR
jgi:hypothetical protein